MTHIYNDSPGWTNSVKHVDGTWLIVSRHPVVSLTLRISPFRIVSSARTEVVFRDLSPCEGWSFRVAADIHLLDKSKVSFLWLFARELLSCLLFRLFSFFLPFPKTLKFPLITL